MLCHLAEWVQALICAFAAVGVVAVGAVVMATIDQSEMDGY